VKETIFGNLLGGGYWSDGDYDGRYLHRRRSSPGAHSLPPDQPPLRTDLQPSLKQQVPLG